MVVNRFLLGLLSARKCTNFLALTQKKWLHKCTILIRFHIPYASRAKRDESSRYLHGFQ